MFSFVFIPLIPDIASIVYSYVLFTTKISQEAHSVLTAHLSSTLLQSSLSDGAF